jgi:hypothetical protein
MRVLGVVRVVIHLRYWEYNWESYYWESYYWESYYWESYYWESYYWESYYWESYYWEYCRGVSDRASLLGGLRKGEFLIRVHV